MFGICNLSIVPLRLEPSDLSEMVNQVLFGEHFTVLEQGKKWSKIKLAFDGYEGYIDNKQYREIAETDFRELEESAKHYAGDLIDFITDNSNRLTTIPLGAHLPFLRTTASKSTSNAIPTKGSLTQVHCQKAIS